MGIHICIVPSLENRTPFPHLITILIGFIVNILHHQADDMCRIFWWHCTYKKSKTVRGRSYCLVPCSGYLVKHIHITQNEKVIRFLLCGCSFCRSICVSPFLFFFHRFSWMLSFGFQLCKCLNFKKNRFSLPNNITVRRMTMMSLWTVSTMVIWLPIANCMWMNQYWSILFKLK